MTTQDKYSVILADPPWRYRVFRPGMKLSKAARFKSPTWFGVPEYPVMDRAQIAALPIGDLAAPNSALFMWATMPVLPEAIELMRAWGFTYKTVGFTWVKTERSGRIVGRLGHYTRSASEVCLLGMRGRMQRRDTGVCQVIVSPLREHSRKPDAQYGRIMRLFEGPYVELFARQQWPGWHTAFSNQANLYPAQTFLMEAV